MPESCLSMMAARNILTRSLRRRLPVGTLHHCRSITTTTNVQSSLIRGGGVPQHLRPFSSNVDAAAAAVTNASTTSSSATVEHSEDDGSIFWAFGMLGALLSANVLAVWCETRMTPNESLLQGLATLNKKESIKKKKEEVAEEEDAAASSTENGNGNVMGLKRKRRTTRIVHFRL